MTTTIRKSCSIAIFTALVIVVATYISGSDQERGAQAAGGGGVLRVGLVEAPQGFDPGLATIGASHQIIDLVYSRLGRLDAEANVVPDVAQSWDISDNGTVYTFHLRKDVFFHNGEQLTADDVAFTFQRLVNPKTGYSYITQLESVKEVTALDKFTVRFRLSQPTGPFLTFLAFPGSSIVPKSVVEGGGKLTEKPIGSGPFKFASYEPGTKLILERNERYYAPGKPQLDRLEIHYIPNPTERTNALLGSIVDFISFVDPKDYDRIVKTSGFKGSDRVGGRWYWIMVNTTNSPLNDSRIRQAISLAIDRQALADALFFGHAKPILGGPIPQWNWAYAPDLNITPPHGDPQKARALLAEAGYAKGLKLTMTMGSAWPNLVEQGPLIKAALEKIGMTVELTTMENPRYLDLVWAGAQYQLSNMFWLSPLADPDDFMYLNYRCGSPMNPQKYCNKQLDDILQRARYTLDKTQRVKLYHEAQAFTLKEMPLIPTVIAANLDAYSARVKGYVATRTGMYSTFDAVSVKQ